MDTDSKMATAIAMTVMDLPLELLDQILSYLDVEPPSLRALRKEPSITLTDSDAQPLKTLSLTSCSLRRLTICRLFKYARIRLDRLSINDIVELSSGSEDINDFLDFVRLNALHSHIKGLVLYTEVDLSTELSPTGPRRSRDAFGNWGFYEFAHLWRNLLTALNPVFITMLAPPSTLALLASCDCQPRDAWAFDMPFNVLHLKQSYTALPAGWLEPPGVNDLFHLRDWSHCSLNEGASLKAYSTYEYFLKTTPSIALLPFTLTASFTSFDYIAIFPLHNHTKEISQLLMKMPNLERLRVQLAPEPSNSKILEDEARMGKNLHADMWMELDAGYTLILHTMLAMRRLEYFESLDYALEGLRSTLDVKFEDIRSQGWRQCGGGCWRRDWSLDPTLEHAMAMDNLWRMWFRNDLTAPRP